jgi:hypothetical protein
VSRSAATGLGLLALLLAGCGYSLEGRGITTDPSIKTIGVPLFKDSTGKYDLDSLVTEAVVSELLKRGRFTVVKEKTGVDAIVEGQILSFDVVPINFTESGQFTEATRYAITLSASVTYRKVGQRDPIWSNESYSLRDEYDLDDSASDNFFDREQQSMERLAESFARGLVAAMLEAF